jgi:putative protease
MTPIEEKSLPELLAPAGNIESFFAALENGADAIYVGYRRHSARALAANFSLEEIARLREYAHDRKVRLYIALNALVRETELRELVTILAGLAKLRPDGLIIQDGAVARLCRRHFPELDLHASTLMTVHNTAGVEQLESMGFHRAVLARELTLDEVAQIAASTRLQLEVFVHGALCFSYSGLCLASSFHGGRSSLRGRCTQPCRRLYHSGRDQGYFFSTNDLSAVELIPMLRDIRLAAFKIEGRMKPASYVAAVVRAYRLVIDAPPGNEAEAVSEARRVLQEAPGRRPTQGFFILDRHKEILSPHRSGASGRLAARVEWVRGKRMALKLRLALAEGDRLRLDSDDEAVEKSAFTLRDMLANGQRLTEATSGMVVTVRRIGGARRGDRLFKTGAKSGPQRSTAKLRRILRENTSDPPAVGVSPALTKKILARPKAARSKSRPNTFYLRLSDRRLLRAAFNSPARWIVLQATRSNLSHYMRNTLPLASRKRLYWALPAIIHEKDLPFYQEKIHRLQEIGHGLWLVANWSHFSLFSWPPESLICDYSFNVLNSQAGSLLRELGCRSVILSLENDRSNLRKLLPALRGLIPLIIIYGQPALFTSRLEVRPRQSAAIRGIGKDPLRQRRQADLTPVWSDRTLCLLNHLQELRKFGANNFVVDLQGQRLRTRDLNATMKNVLRQRCPQPHSTFNYLRQLA